MKKKLLLLLSMAVGYSTMVMAQSIPNGNFETWTSIPYDEPNGWITSNSEVLRFNEVNVTKVPGVTGSAIKIQTKAFGIDTMGGFFTNTGGGDPTSGEGGVPYNQKPQTFSGKYMANMVGNDSAIILVIFKKNGTLLGQNFFTLGGKNQTTFSTFTFTVTPIGIPDSVILAFASSNLETNKNISNGSSIVFDDFSFAGIGVNKPIPNGNFELWSTFAKDIPAGWNELSGMVNKDTSRYKGQYAIKLSSIDHGKGFVEVTSLTTGDPFQQGSPTGGKPFSNKTDTICGYYKFFSSTGDSALFAYTVSKNGNPAGGEALYLKPVSAYTYFEIPINLFAAPDLMRIDVQSLAYPFSDDAKGTLYLDNIQLKSAPLSSGLITSDARNLKHNFYPNPVSNILNINTGMLQNEIGSVSVFDLTGTLILNDYSTNGSSLIINTASLVSGVYFYIIVTESGTVLRNKFIKE
nr:T9SS type A sorting domain-containing protein [Pseudopedobacter sp.]